MIPQRGGITPPHHGRRQLRSAANGVEHTATETISEGPAVYQKTAYDRGVAFKTVRDQAYLTAKATKELAFRIAASVAREAYVRAVLPAQGVAIRVASEAEAAAGVAAAAATAASTAAAAAAAATAFVTSTTAAAVALAAAQQAEIVQAQAASDAK